MILVIKSDFLIPLYCGLVTKEMINIENREKGANETEAPLEMVLVDSDPITCLINRIHLENFFSQPVKVFYNGIYALEYIWKQLHENHKVLVLLEIFIPETEGWEFLELCNSSQSKNLRIIIITTSVSSKVRLKALSYPQVVGFYEKPLLREDLPRIAALLI